MAVSDYPNRRETQTVSELADLIPDRDVMPVPPQGDDTLSPSSARIKALALEKRRAYLNENEVIPMKRASFRVALIAAVICLISLTAFAAFGGLDYIKSIFGESAVSLQNEIITPQVSASSDGRDLALEALLTDGYVTNLVVSLTGAMPSGELRLFQVSIDGTLRSVSWSDMPAFSTADKTYYAVEIVSEARFEAADMILSLDPEIADITLPFTVENKLGNAVVTFPEGALSGETALKELQVSPMGFLLIGHESNAQGGLPPTHIQLCFAQGRTESIDVEFAPSDETVSGGGGAILDGNAALPLVTSFHGTRNPSGALVISGTFSRIINPANIEKIIIDGVEYPIN